MDKEHMCYQYAGILFSHKKGSSAIWDNMDGGPGYHTKSDRERETLCDPYMWNLKNQTHLFVPTPPGFLPIANHQLFRSPRRASPSSLPGRLSRALSLGTIPSLTRAGKWH